MSTDVAAITFRCEDPRKVAEFWANALGREVAATASSGSAAVLAAVPLFFRPADPQAGAENNIHLDLSTNDFAGDVRRLRELGATEVGRYHWHSTESATFLDIEGNQFDLIAQ
jgi:catechol-2,3-dioxygenase